MIVIAIVFTMHADNDDSNCLDRRRCTVITLLLHSTLRLLHTKGAIYFGYPVVFTYYTKNHFGWASNTNGLFGMLDDFARGFGMVVLLPIAVWALGGKALSCAPMVTRKPHQRDKLFLCVALVVTMAQYGAYAFVPASASNTFLGLTAAGIVGGVQAPLLRGLFSKQYEPHEYGICFGAIATMESTFQLVWYVLYFFLRTHNRCVYRASAAVTRRALCTTCVCPYLPFCLFFFFF